MLGGYVRLGRGWSPDRSIAGRDWGSGEGQKGGVGGARRCVRRAETGCRMRRRGGAAVKRAMALALGLFGHCGSVCGQTSWAAGEKGLLRRMRR